MAFLRDESSHHSKPQYVRTVATYLHLKPYGCDPILPSGKFPLAPPDTHSYIIALLKNVRFLKLHQPVPLFFSVFSISFNIISLTVLSATLRICSPPRHRVSWPQKQKLEAALATVSAMLLFTARCVQCIYSVVYSISQTIGDATVMHCTNPAGGWRVQLCKLK